MRIAGTTLLLLALVLAACDGPVQPNYYGTDKDPLPGGQAPPVLAAAVPDRGFPGDEVVLIGEGFRPAPGQTMINFGTAVAEILEISEDRVTVRVPANASGGQRVRASVWGAEEWSNEITFSYLEDYVAFKFDIPAPKGVAVDDEKNLYVSSGSRQAIYRINAVDSSMSTLATLPVTGPMDFGPGGDLYVVTQNGVDRVTAGGGVENVVSLPGATGFDWDANGDLYVLVAKRVHRWREGTLTEVATVTQAQRLRVFDGYVYITELTRARVSRFKITPDGLGAQEIYFNAGTAVAGLDFDAKGNVYAGGYVRDYVLKAAPDREDDGDVTEIPDADDRANPFRKVANRLSVVYIHGSVMYLVQDDPNGKVWRIFIDEQSAPRYGRQ